MTRLTTTQANTSSQQSSSSALFGRLGNISSRLTDRLKESGVSTGALGANLESFMGNFLPAHKDLTVTKITESIM
jgi:hypothetical protein